MLLLTQSTLGILEQIQVYKSRGRFEALESIFTSNKEETTSFDVDLCSQHSAPKLT
jgi:hypothetical protein